MPGQPPSQVQHVGIAGQQSQQIKDAQLLQQQQQQQQQIHQQQLAQLIQQQGLQQSNIVVKMTDVQPISSVGEWFYCVNVCILYCLNKI